MTRLVSTLATIVAVVVLIGIVALASVARWTEAVPSVADSATQTVPSVATPPAPVPNAVVGEVGVPAAAYVSLDPINPPEELPGACEGHLMTLERANTTVGQDIAASSAVVVGSIEAVGAAQWNMPRGKAPTERPDIAPSRVMRLVRISVETTLSGDPASPLIGYVPGGQIGCHEFRIGGFPFDLSQGDRFVMFLADNRPRSGIEGVVEVWQMWPIEGDTVVTPHGDKPLGEVLTAARG